MDRDNEPEGMSKFIEDLKADDERVRRENQEWFRRPDY